MSCLYITHQITNRNDESHLPLFAPSYITSRTIYKILTLVSHSFLTCHSPIPDPGQMQDSEYVKGIEIRSLEYLRLCDSTSGSGKTLCNPNSNLPHPLSASHFLAPRNTHATREALQPRLLN